MTRVKAGSDKCELDFSIFPSTCPHCVVPDSSHCYHHYLSASIVLVSTSLCLCLVLSSLVWGKSGKKNRKTLHCHHCSLLHSHCLLLDTGRSAATWRPAKFRVFFNFSRSQSLQQAPLVNLSFYLQTYAIRDCCFLLLLKILCVDKNEHIYGLIRFCVIHLIQPAFEFEPYSLTIVVKSAL